MPDTGWRTPRCTCTAASASTSTTRCTATSWRPNRRSSRWAAPPASCCASAGNWLTHQLEPGSRERASHRNLAAHTACRRRRSWGVLRGFVHQLARPHSVRRRGCRSFARTARPCAAAPCGRRVAEHAVLLGGARRRGDVRHADCQLVLADSASAAILDGIDHIDVDSAQWASEVHAHEGAPVIARAAEPSQGFMLIYTLGTSGDPRAVICSHGKVAIAGVTMTERFSLGPDDVCYVSMALFHSNAVLVGWSVSLACRGSMVLRRKFSASQFLPDVRRYGATYANYVGKPLSYVLATPELPDDADNPLRAVYGNEGAPGDVERFARRFGTVVIDGVGSAAGRVAIQR